MSQNRVSDSEVSESNLVESQQPPQQNQRQDDSAGENGVVSSSAANLNNSSSDEVSSSILDCPVCLQPSVHPVELPCGHIFCFLCIKGVATQGGGQPPRCAICRSNIPTYVLTNPRLKDISQLYKDDKSCSGYQWFYESRSGDADGPKLCTLEGERSYLGSPHDGWWQYEERTMQELEKAFETKQTSCQLLIAGHMYDIDFTQMIQFRVGNRNLFRRIKRDVPTAEKRGIAGIRVLQGANAQLIHQQTTQNGRRRPSGTGRVSAASANPATQSTNSDTPPRISPADSQQSGQEEEDSDQDENVFTDSDDEEDVDDMELGEEEESETDDYYNDDDDELRDGARAPTSRSDRSTSSFNQTPPPCLLTSSASGTTYSTRGKSSKSTSQSGSRSTPPGTGSTPNSATISENASSSPVSPAFCLSPTNVCSPTPSINTTSGTANGISTSIQIGPRLRITVDYMGEDEIL